MITVKSEDIGDVEDLINDFYRSIWENVKRNTIGNCKQNNIGIDQFEFDKRRKFFLENLVKNEKRNLVIEDTLTGDEIDRIIKDELIKEGLLRSIPTDRRTFYQLFHDRLIKPLTEDLVKLKAEEKSRKEIDEEKKKFEMKILKENAEKESRLRERAESSKKKAKKLAVAAFVVALIAIYFYFDADQANKEAEMSNDSLKVKTEKLQKAAATIEKQQALSKANEKLIYGDSYKNLKEDTLARASYLEGLGILINYQTDSLYKVLQDKVKE